MNKEVKTIPSFIINSKKDYYLVKWEGKIKYRINLDGTKVILEDRSNKVGE